MILYDPITQVDIRVPKEGRASHLSNATKRSAVKRSYWISEHDGHDCEPHSNIDFAAALKNGPSIANQMSH